MKIIKRTFDSRNSDIYAEYKILTDDNREKYLIFYITEEYLVFKRLEKSEVENFLDSQVKEADLGKNERLESIIFCTTPEGGEKAKEFLKSEFSSIEKFTIKYI